MKNDIVRISHETQTMRDRIKDNKEKIKVNKTLPYLVSNVIEVIENSLFDCFIFLNLINLVI
jgi:26S proteasome regulatory subunit T5